jgi:formate dehydrogenase major subunit
MTIALTIDGERVEVREGATILDAARQAGHSIPTLCHLDGVEPVGSCFLCVVSVEGKRNLIPSCVAPAEDGMVVVTESDEIRQARKMALELLMSDHVGDCDAPCTVACPAHLDIPGFIRLILEGKHDSAVALVRERIPLPGALGRICPRYCERACRRGQVDDPVAICILKRFVADQEYAAGTNNLPVCNAKTGRSVAIVGAGVAGLSAAYPLLVAGHGCTLFDGAAEAGGKLRYAVPAYRLPRDILRSEIDVIRRLGADFRLGVSVGNGVSIDDLMRDFDAVLVATGAGDVEPLSCEGGDLAVSAFDVLASAAEGRPDMDGQHVVVVGDGLEAVAAARTVLRLGAERATIIASRKRARMSCPAELVADAEAEGVRVEDEAAIEALRREGDGALECTVVRDGDRFEVGADVVVAGAQRRVDFSALRRLGLPVSKRGAAVDSKTLMTEREGLFAAGEVATGPGAAVRAVASGVSAAVCIDQYLRGEPVVGEVAMVNVRMGRPDPEDLRKLAAGYPDTPRIVAAEADAPRRAASFEEVAAGLTEAQAIEEAARCLHCDCRAREDCKLRVYATEYGAEANRFRGEKREFDRDDSHGSLIYESGKCILCGLCVRISEHEGEEMGMAFRNRGFVTRVGAPFARSLEGALHGCAPRCAAACPTGALADGKADV